MEHKKPAHESVTKEEEGKPKHVGKSTTRRGEDVVKNEGKEPGRYDTGPKGQSQRPSGKSTARDKTGVDPQEPIAE